MMFRKLICFFIGHKLVLLDRSRTIDKLVCIRCNKKLVVDYSAEPVVMMDDSLKVFKLEKRQELKRRTGR